jgi:hypothetical protein
MDPVQEDLTELEKLIYNKHNIVSRQKRNKPFKVRKDFSKFDDPSKKLFLKRISTLFRKFKEINIDEYFGAPYDLYPDVVYFDLQYFSSPRAIKCYSIFKQQFEYSTADIDQFIEPCKESFIFVMRYCVKHNIELNTYFSLTDAAPVWRRHLKEQKITPYTLLSIPDFYNYITTIPKDERELFFGAFASNFPTIYHNFLSSKLKTFLQQAYDKTEKFIARELINPKNNP